MIKTVGMELTHGMLNEWTDERYRSFNFNRRVIVFKIIWAKQRNPFSSKDLDRTLGYFFCLIFPKSFVRENIFRNAVFAKSR